MATAADHSLPNTAEPDKPLIIINLAHVLKLTSTNYIPWKNQVEATLLGYGLFSYLDGSHPTPPQTTTVTTTTADTPPKQTTTTTPNPAYTTWFRQDKLLLSALSGTLSPSIVSLISLCPTSHDAWQTLAKTYANPSRGHLKQIKDRLRSITKGTKSITDYMQEIKSCSDQLASLGKPLDPEDLVDRVLDQLHDTDYDSVILAVQSRDTPISFDELHEKLLNREVSLKHRPSANPVTFPSSVHYTHKPNSSSNRTNPNHNSFSQPNRNNNNHQTHTNNTQSQ